MEGVSITKLGPIGPGEQSYTELGLCSSERGDTAVIARNEPFTFIALLTFNRGFSRGNHYHFKRHERFYVTKGKLLGRFRNLKTGEELEQEFETGALISITPGIAHAFKGLEDSEAIEFSNIPYDPKDQEKVGLF